VKRVVIAVALLFGVTACATSIRPQALPAGDPRPRQLLDAWVERAGARERLRALARIAVDGYDGSVRLRGKQLVILERPSRLRVEILGFLNQSLAVIATDGAAFDMFRADDQSYETGVVDERLLWNEARIDLSPEEAVAVLLGIPLFPSKLAPVNAVRDHKGRIRIDLADSRGTVVQRVSFDLVGQLRSLVVFDESGATLWEARFDAYRDVDGSAFAHLVELDVRAGTTHAEISFRNVELNPDLPVGLFRLFPDDPVEAPGSGADSR